MNEIYRIANISELNQFFNQPKPKHPLISVMDFSKIDGFGDNEGRFTSDFYSIMFKNHCTNKMKYGREYFDFQDGTIFFIAPKQVITFEKEDISKKEVYGWGLFFHPDLFRGTALGSKMKEYTFFSYEMNEALHLSDKEKQTLTDIVLHIELELAENIDKHSSTIIISNIEMLLNYCTRYYERQFITRTNSNKNILSRFELTLEDYLNSDLLQKNGLPTVSNIAQKLFLSPNYLSDLLKKETGKNAQEHIHYYLIDIAKSSLLNTNNSVSQIAYNLGFEYPQYFSKLFKNKTGLTPIEFRNLN
jgi:AraC-like DNA-binding protein